MVGGSIGFQESLENFILLPECASEHTRIHLIIYRNLPQGPWSKYLVKVFAVSFVYSQSVKIDPFQD